MFADDTTIYYIGREVEEIVDTLNLVLNGIKRFQNVVLQEPIDLTHWKDRSNVVM